MRVKEHIVAMGRAFLLAFTASASARAMVTMGEVMVAGQTSPPAVFTAQQATAGKAQYAKHCASCHSPDLSGNGEISALAGPTFMETWGPRSTKQFFDYISAAMPYGQPSLTTEAYTEISAFILQSNRAVAGESMLTATTSVSIRSVTASK
jgi:mono/diheme cytochrome c family protein